MSGRWPAVKTITDSLSHDENISLSGIRVGKRRISLKHTKTYATKKHLVH
jgi:hypothetical protein